VQYLSNIFLFSLGLIYEIIEGGFRDIGVKITGPDGQDIETVEQESSGKITFSANLDGKYRYCFSNRMSTLTPKVVMFNLDVEEPHENKDPEHEGMCAQVMKSLICH